MRESAPPLDDIIITPLLATRAERHRDWLNENRVLRRLMQDVPRTDKPLDLLLAAAIDLCLAGSAGISLLTAEDDGREFHWVAMAGAYADFVGGTTPANFSPCGTTLARGTPQLFSYPDRVFTYFQGAGPRIVEGLVIPFHIDGQGGTIWIVSHDESRRFTPGDLDVMTALGDFTASVLSLEARAVRERDARHRAEAADRAKDDFLATVSHELRTPLHSIIGWADLLSEPDLDAADAIQAVASVQHAAERQSRLVDDLLDMSRIVAGTLALELRPIDIRAVVLETVDTVTPMAELGQVRLEVHTNLQAAVIADAGRLQQALSNVMTNAIKFTDAGGTVRVEASANTTDVVVRVCDTGIGIAPELLPHVFDRFKQGDSSPQRNRGGVGLGLAIAREIVFEHGGHIEAASAGLGLGATFTINLPCARAPVGSLSMKARPAEAGPALILAGARILVVDDDNDGREMVAESLRRRGALVYATSSVEDAKRVLTAFAGDLLLSDIAMPRQDGCELIRWVREREDSTALIKAAALSARSTPFERERALAAGFDAYYSKPMSPADLVMQVAGLLRRHCDTSEIVIPDHKKTV